MNRQASLPNEYRRQLQRKNSAIALTCIVLLALSFFISLNSGYIKLSPLDAFRTLAGFGSPKEELILFTFRLPRIIISALVGASLALAGAIVQGITKNPLADPGLLGINAGAGLMVIVYVLIFGNESILSVFTLPFAALLGGMFAAFLIYILAYKKNEHASAMSLILTGVGIQAALLALTMLLVIKLDETQFDFFANWQAGSMWGTSWKFVIALLPWVLLCVPLALYKVGLLDILSLGDETAIGLGVNINKEKIILLVLAVALASSSVAVSSNLSFIGLIAPHLTRKLVRGNSRIVIGVCILVGAVLVSIADTVSRIIVQPSEIPTGVTVAILGAPYFLYLLASNKV